MRRIAEEEARAKAEAAAREEAIRKSKRLERERKQAEIFSRKRKLAYERNNIQNEYYSEELERPDWNREYIEYLEKQFIRDATLLSEEELTVPIMTREEFEKEQAIALYCEKADQAGALWDKALSELFSVTHNWKWEYMDYLEGIRFRDLLTITLREAKEEVMREKEQEQEMTGDILSDEEVDKTVTTKIVEEPITSQSVDAAVKTIEKVISESLMEETIEPTVEAIPIDFIKLTTEERAVFLPVPTDDIKTEYDGYCKRMGYITEKLMSIQYIRCLCMMNFRRNIIIVRDSVKCKRACMGSIQEVQSDKG